VENFIHVADETQSPWANGDPREQIPQHRPDADTGGKRHRDDGGK
jgi:hypothetical protein